MAYFERCDERDKLIVCNICYVKCAERSITIHKSRCRENYKYKFDKNELLVCSYDASHIIPIGGEELHHEFCHKYQKQILGECQILSAANVPPAYEDGGKSSQPETNSEVAGDNLADEISKLNLAW